MERNPVTTSASDLWGWKESGGGVGPSEESREVTAEEQQENP